MVEMPAETLPIRPRKRRIPGRDAPIVPATPVGMRLALRALRRAIPRWRSRSGARGSLAHGVGNARRKRPRRGSGLGVRNSIASAFGSRPPIPAAVNHKRVFGETPADGYSLCVANQCRPIGIF